MSVGLFVNGNAGTGASCSQLPAALDPLVSAVTASSRSGL